MRLLWVMVAAGLVFAQTKQTRDPRSLVLIGNRFAPLKYDSMTPEQRAVMDHLAAGERVNVRGPFNFLLRSPEAGDFWQDFGGAVRYRTGFSKDVTEAMILTSGRYWDAQFVWSSHKDAAKEAGVPPGVMEDIKNGRRPRGMSRDMEIAYNFLDELWTSHQVSDAAFQAVKDRYGLRGAADLIGLAGWYGMVSMVLAVDDYPLDPGEKPEMPVMAKPLPVAGSGLGTPIPGKPDPVVVNSSANGKAFRLSADRFRPLPWEQMSDEQKKFTEFAIAGRGTGAAFPVTLHSPEMGRIFFAIGERVRFHMSVPDRLKELAILLTARYWGAQYEWSVHAPAAKQAGLSDEKIKAIAEGRRPAGMAADEEVVYRFITELYKTHKMSTATFQAVKKAVGERGVVDLVNTAGYYETISMLMNVDRMPLEGNGPLVLKPLAKPLP